MYQPTSLSLTIMRNFRKSFEKGSENNLLHDPMFIFMVKYFLQCHGNEEMQIEACWIFTNVAAGTTEQTRILVDNGIIPILANLLSSSNIILVEQALWALGNVVGDSPELRDEVLKFNVIGPILNWIESFSSLTFPNSFIRTFAWALVNFVRCREDSISVHLAQQLIPAFHTIVAEPLDEQAMIDALWGLTYIADCGNEYIQAMVDYNIIDTSIVLINSQRSKLQLSAVRLLGNIATGTDEQTNRLIEHGVPINIRDLLFSRMPSIRRTTLWCLSNITVGPAHHARAVIDSGLLPGIALNLKHYDMKVIREAVFTFRNLIQYCDHHSLIDISSSHAIGILFDLVMHDNVEISYAADDGLRVYFRKSMELVREQNNNYFLQTI